MNGNVGEPSIEIYGVSVRGPAHTAEGTPNQDAWRRGRVGSTRIVAVSDGLGSRPYARMGALAACQAVVEAIRQWRRNPRAPMEVLLGLIHLLWRVRVAPLAPEDCACTCLFAAIEPDGSGVAAQLGDGLIILNDGKALTNLTDRAGGHFTNETSALGITTRLSAWSKINLDKGPRSLVLCTDGVADDLLPERLAEFVGWLTTDIRSEIPARRRHILSRALRDWPTPKHIDDKTVAVIHVPGGGI